MVKIRLTRTGKKHQPHYRIVAVDSRRPRDGKYIEKIGYYNPRTKPPTLEYDKDLLKKWLENGAQMTDTVHDIFVKEGIIKQSGKRKARLDLITKPEEKTEEGESAKDESSEKPAKSDESDDEKDKSDTADEKPAEEKKEEPKDTKNTKDDRKKKEDDGKKKAPKKKDAEKSDDDKTGEPAPNTAVDAEADK